MPYHRLCKLTEIKNDGFKSFQIEDKNLAVYLIEDKLFAVEDSCPHRGATLSEGKVENSEVTCQWHGARFNIQNGKWLSGTPTRDLKVYTLKVNDGFIEVEI